MNVYRPLLLPSLLTLLLALPLAGCGDEEEHSSDGPSRVQELGGLGLGTFFGSGNGLGDSSGTGNGLGNSATRGGGGGGSTPTGQNDGAGGGGERSSGGGTLGGSGLGNPTGSESSSGGGGEGTGLGTPSGGGSGLGTGASPDLCQRLCGRTFECIDELLPEGVELDAEELGELRAASEECVSQCTRQGIPPGSEAVVQCILTASCVDVQNCIPEDDSDSNGVVTTPPGNSSNDPRTESNGTTSGPVGGDTCAQVCSQVISQCGFELTQSDCQTQLCPVYADNLGCVLDASCQDLSEGACLQ